MSEHPISYAQKNGSQSRAEEPVTKKSKIVALVTGEIAMN